MAIFTVEDRDKIKIALMELAGGARTVTVNLKSASGDRDITYGQANIRDLEGLLARVNANLSGARGVVHPRSVK